MSFSAMAVSTLPFYEPFPSTYTEGERLGGTTTIGVWTAGNSAGADSVSNMLTAALSYSGLSTTAGSRGAFFTGNSPGSGRVRGAGFTPQTPGAGNPTFYASFLLNIISSPTNNRCVVSLDASTGSTPSGTVGCWVDTANHLLVGKTTLTTPAVATTAALTAGTTHLVVLKYQWTSATAGDDVVSLFLDPLPGASEPAATLTTATGTDASTLNTFYCIQGSASGAYKSGSFQVDEIRVSTSWADVTPSSVCTGAGISTNPVNQAVAVGATANFSITATGSVPTYQWQVSTDNGANWNNVSTGTGGTTASYTTATLAAGDNGSQFRAIANVSCNSSSATSGVATLTVSDPTGKWFRSVTSGNWSSASTWEQSTDGSIWVAANVTPSSVASNITVRAGHTVSVTAAVAADDLTIEATGELDASGATLTITNGSPAIDCNVNGVLKVASAAGSALVTTGAGMQFNNGSAFKWSNASAPSLPLATWSDGSLCRIEATASTASFATNISGQSFYDFVFDTTVGGQVQRCRFGIQGVDTAIRHNFSVNIPDTANAAITIGNGTNAVLTVGGDVTFATGSTVNTTKILFNNGAGNSLTFKVGGNFSASGYLDGFGATTTLLEFTRAGSQTFAAPADAAHYLNSGIVSYQVDAAATLALGSAIPGAAGVTVNSNATLNLSGNLFTGAATAAFTINSGATVLGSGTTQLTAGFGTLNYGGTVNLGTLPAFAGGETFVLFGGSATPTYSGSFTLLPSTPSGSQTWDITALNTTGTLGVSGGAGPSAGHIDSATVSGGNVVLAISGGTASTAFTVVGTTNLTTARTNWPVIGSGTFNGAGAATVTNPAPGNARFHSLRVP
ncbi:MAG: hypothetical protein RLZZ350_33 [Verrucomicrobiota bacterium]